MLHNARICNVMEDFATKCKIVQSIATQSKGLQKMQDNAKLFCPTVAMQLEYIAMQGFAMPCNGRYELQCRASQV